MKPLSPETDQIRESVLKERKAKEDIQEIKGKIKTPKNPTIKDLEERISNLEQFLFT